MWSSNLFSLYISISSSHFEALESMEATQFSSFFCAS